MRILVTGATGYVGSRLVSALLENGHDVVAATRDPEKLGRFGWCDQVSAVVLDAGDPSVVEAAFAVAGPIDVVYYLVHGIGQAGYRDRDNAAAATVAAAAAAAGVRRIVYLGGFVPDDHTLSEHLAGRAEVASALTVEGGPELVWLGAAVIIGAGSTSFELVRYVGDRFWVIPLPPWADHDIDPISIRDALHYLVAAADPAQVRARRLRHRRADDDHLPGPAAELRRRDGSGARGPAGARRRPAWADGTGRRCGRAGADRSGGRSHRIAGPFDDGLRHCVA